ncbi:MAG: hypothetical protein ACKN9V_07230, partial [Pseudomonadota bacterium]
MKVRIILTGILSAICGLALFAGVLSNHQGAIAFLAALFLAETVFWKWKFFSRSLFSKAQKTERRLIGLFSRNTEQADLLLCLEIQERLRLNPVPKDRELLLNLMSLLELRHLIAGVPKNSKEALQEAFILRQKKQEDSSTVQSRAFSVDDFSIQDIADAATLVSSLLWKSYRISGEEGNPLANSARSLIEPLNCKSIENLTDSIQREGGVPFLVLNLISRGQWEWAKPLGQRLLTSDISLEEESRACLYWMTEIQCFTRQETTIPDFETTIRYLYHLCFINPERAGFLEIDSQFFSQFEMVNELAKEGFLFKETLVDRVLHLWGEQTGFFED